MLGFGNNLKIGKTYTYNIVVAAVGITSWSGRNMVVDGTGFFTAEDGMDRETAEANLKAEAIAACRQELPGASRYIVITFQEI